MAGVPALNASLYRRIRFLVGDPVALIEVPLAGRWRSTLLLRDIEMERAKQHARVDSVFCPENFEPSTGLSGDRETATAQAMVEFLKRSAISECCGDRTLPLIFVELARQAGITVHCDMLWGVHERRQKDEQEIGWLREAQAATESVMERACLEVLNAEANRKGELLDREGGLLTSEVLRARIDRWLIEMGYSSPGSIVASGPIAADCHHHGTGPIRTGDPVIIDIFPRHKTTLYNGDCTRTVVHGEISDLVDRMHRAVVAAKSAAEAVIRPGVTGEEVHRATIGELEANGFGAGSLDTAADDEPRMTHGTGHGIGLEVHEPPLLAKSGPELVFGDALTVEPGLYCRAVGGIRVEDLVIVTQDGHENLNKLPQDLKLGT